MVRVWLKFVKFLAPDKENQNLILGSAALPHTKLNGWSGVFSMFCRVEVGRLRGCGDNCYKTFSYPPRLFSCINEALVGSISTP